MDKEFLQYIKEMEYNDLLEMNEKNISKYKNTFHYQIWQLKEACENLKKAYADFADAMRETKMGSAIIWIAEFLNKCIEKIF